LFSLFSLFLVDLKQGKQGKQACLKGAQMTEEAQGMGQLYTGKGNLIGQAKEFEKLGVSVQTPLPEHLVAKAALELGHLPETADDTQLETIEQ